MARDRSINIVKVGAEAMQVALIDIFGNNR